jgi:hypothetical protein
MARLRIKFLDWGCLRIILFNKKLNDMISLEEKYNDPGIFNFNENGFSFNIDKTITEKKWNEIEEINVYKKDLLTVDLICMDIVFGETYITFTEDT